MISDIKADVKQEIKELVAVSLNFNRGTFSKRETRLVFLI